MTVGLEPLGPSDPEWEALADLSEAPPYHRPGWFRVWASVFSPGRDPVVLTLRDRDGRMRAAVPVLRGAETVSPTNVHSPGFGAVSDSPQSLAELAVALVGLAPTVRIGPVDAAGDLRAAVRDVTGRRRFIVRERPMIRSPYVDIGDEGPLALVSRSLRKEIGRGTRRLAETGEVRLDIARGPDESGPALEALLDIEARGWKGEDGTAIVSDPLTLAFYRAVTRWAAETGRLRLAVLRVAGRPVAAELDLAEGRALYSLKMGFDPEFAKVGPGHILVAQLLEAVRHEGITRYEMLGDDDAYKLRWTDRVREMVEVAAYAPTPRGLTRLGRARVTHAVARRLRERARPAART